MKQESLDELKELFGDSINDLLKKYLEDSNSLMNILEKSINSNDIDGIVQTAHPLKSSSRQIGAEKFADIAMKIEHNGKNNDDSSMKNDYQQLQLEYKQVCEYLTHIING
jgi:HPt (histidine-containing phosphotransfer) domain-containing protein